jgi:hypothetical protein
LLLAGTAALRSRPRSFFRLPLDPPRSSLPTVSAEIIPPSLMGHVERHLSAAVALIKISLTAPS